LIYQLGTIGDTVITIPALRAIRNHYGAMAELYLLHEKHKDISYSPEDILSGGRDVDYFISYNYKTSYLANLLNGFRLWINILMLRFDVVIYLAPSERPSSSVKRDAFFFKLCGVFRQVGFKAFSRQTLFPYDEFGHPLSVPHEAIFRLERLKSDGIVISDKYDFSKILPALPSRFCTKPIEWITLRRKHPERQLIALCPGTKQPANSWPIDRFIELGSRIIGLNKYEIVIVGGPAEKNVGESIVQSWGGGINAAGEFSILESACILKLCTMLIGLDTGTTHLAAAVGVKCFGIYGCREHPGRWEPLGNRHVVIRSSVKCAGCRLRDCNMPKHPCMNNITVDEVWKLFCSEAK
jgi:ADP-heptose:LPS heptosyltransferase